MATSSKKSKKNRSIDYEANANADSVPEVIKKSTEVSPHKKKKKRSAEKLESDGDNTLNCTPLSEITVVDGTTPKKKKKKSKDKGEKITESVSTLESGSQKEMNESKAIDDLKIHVVEESTDAVSSEKKKKKKRKRHENIEENSSEDTKTENKEELKFNDNDSFTEPVPQPALSALTRERMEKWKKRKPTKNISFLQDNETNASAEPEKEENKNIKSDSGRKKPGPTMYNPNMAIQNYNHKRVLAALGYDVKKYENKHVKIEMPPTKIPGSNLDSILGYGEGLPCK